MNIVLPWCRLVDHSWEHIVLNGSYGLASKNESSCESVHKVRYIGGMCRF